MEARIVNVVATANLDQKLDLDRLGKLSDVFYNPNVYGGRVAYFKSPNMEGRVSIFTSGKMISMGTKSEEKAYRELNYVRSYLLHKGYLVKPVAIRPETQNIVAIADFGSNVDLEKLTKRYKMIYEPDQFPGGIMRIVEPNRATILIFNSGKTVITGMTNSRQISPILNKVSNIIDL